VIVGGLSFLTSPVCWLLVMTHQYAENMEGESQGQEGCCAHKADILYLVICGVLAIGAFAGIVAMYSFSVKHNCSGMTGLLSVTLIVGVILIVMSVLDVFGAPGLLCPSVVFAYATWLVWSAMTSEPTAECNPYGDDADQPWYVVAIGIIISGLSLAYTSYSAASSAPQLCGGGDDEEEGLTSSLIENRRGQDQLDKVLTGEIKTERDLEAARRKDGADDSDDDGAASDADDDDALRRDGVGASGRKKPEKAWFFHLIMLSAALYMAMLLTNWGTGTDSGSTRSTGLTSLWIKVATQWLTYLLYLWTLIAPVVCKSRDFS